MGAALARVFVLCIFFIGCSFASDLFTKVDKIHVHTHKTRSSSSDNFHTKSSSLNLNQRSFARFGAKLWNSYRDEYFDNSLKVPLKSMYMEAEDNYVETPIPLYKIANFT